VQKEIQRSAYRHTREVEEGSRVVVGVNRFQVDEPAPADLLHVTPRAQQEQIEALRSVRARREGEAVRKALASLKSVAEGGTNLVPAILGAVRVYASIGEICDALRGVFGEYHERIVI
jgi:methylmalonyl-CoA mutase N-terminal domain/subunit